MGIMLIPQGMAYAMIAGLPVVYGLYAALLPQIIYGFLGTSRHLAVGPVAMDSLLVAAGLTGIAVAGTEHYIALALLLAAGASLVTTLRRQARAGRGVAAVVGTLALARPSSTHNWLNSPRSRSSARMPTVKPCVERQRKSFPDLQVNRGQTFQVEWTTVHPGSFSYFVLEARRRPSISVCNWLSSSFCISLFLRACFSASSFSFLSRSFSAAALAAGSSLSSESVSRLAWMRPFFFFLLTASTTGALGAKSSMFILFCF